jgi:hypothetical protein
MKDILSPPRVSAVRNVTESSAIHFYLKSDFIMEEKGLNAGDWKNGLL